MLDCLRRWLPEQLAVCLPQIPLTAITPLCVHGCREILGHDPQLGRVDPHRLVVHVALALLALVVAPHAIVFADPPIDRSPRRGREACERLVQDDSVTLEREPDKVHDSNAILVLAEDDCELGYVPREEARDMALLLDAGAEAEARVRRLWETPEGQIVPIIIAASSRRR